MDTHARGGQVIPLHVGLLYYLAAGCLVVALLDDESLDLFLPEFKHKDLVLVSWLVLCWLPLCVFLGLFKVTRWINRR